MFRGSEAFSFKGAIPLPPEMAFTNSFGLIQRIYVSAFMLVLGSFLCIGLLTYFHTKSENDRANRKFLLDKTESLSTALAYYLEEKKGDIYALYTESFYSRLQQISKVHGLHFEVFDLHGRWISSSAPGEINFLVVPDSISAEELLKLDEAEGNFVYRKISGDQNTLVALRILRNERGSPMAIVKIPYQTSSDETRTEYARFLKSLIISYLLVLAVALLLAFLLSKYITRSLKAVRTQLASTHLYTEYKPLQWKYNDEVGALVEAYNQKLEELRRSAALLSEKERESAWRDMARQVAHEIKNPLTPLQLGIQQLQKAYAESDPDFPSRLLRFSAMMHEQINTLAQIAESFSTYGRMPAPKPVILDLKKEIPEAMHLFEREPNISFSFNSDLHVAEVFVDPDYLRRMLNNLYKNAVQAIEEKGVVETFICQTDSGVDIEVRDNGHGIPPERLERIFSPNFTTKSAGMGLGLSMVRNMVELSGGSVRVVSEVGKGTSFFISLPKA
jgi:nitrogen fixation/metabolism regulation signal transduction histidine kinase